MRIDRKLETEVDVRPGRPGRRRTPRPPRVPRIPERRHGFLRVAGPLAVFILALGIWYLLSDVILRPSARFLLPPPHVVLMQGILTWRSLSEVLKGLESTTKVAMVGLLIAIVLGVGSAILMSRAVWIEFSLYPYAVVLQTIPEIALVPVIGLWVGFDFRSRVIICVMIAIFPIITNTLTGLKSASSEHHDLFRSYGSSRLTRLLKLQLPSALPCMFAGFRISAGLSVIGAIVGDFFFRQGDAGIGRLIDVYRTRLQTPQLFTAVLFSSLLGVVVFWFFSALSHLVLSSWHDSARAR